MGKKKFAGVTMSDGEISYKKERGPVAGAQARVESVGEIQSRVTATRLLATGVFAFAWKKKKDSRELYLTVEGNGFAFVVEVDPKKGGDARRFAAEINASSSRAEAQQTAAPDARSSWPTPPR